MPDDWPDWLLLYSPQEKQVETDSQVRSGQVRSGQVRSGQVRSGQVRSGLVRSGQVRSVRSDNLISPGEPLARGYFLAPSKERKI